jgi:hypothetical protein
MASLGNSGVTLRGAEVVAPALPKPSRDHSRRLDGFRPGRTTTARSGARAAPGRLAAGQENAGCQTGEHAG